MEIIDKESYTLIKWGNSIDHSTVENHKNLLDKVFLPNKNIKFNAIDLCKIDTTGIQLLIFLCMTAKARGIKWHWEKSSEALDEAADTLGASEILQLNKMEDF